MSERHGKWPRRLWICDKGHVDTSTLNGVCWQCYPGGKRTWEPGRPRQTEPNQRHVDVVPVDDEFGDRPVLFVHTDHNPDEVRTFYELPDSLIDLLRGPDDSRTVAQALADLLAPPPSRLSS